MKIRHTVLDLLFLDWDAIVDGYLHISDNSGFFWLKWRKCNVRKEYDEYENSFMAGHIRISCDRIQLVFII